MPDSEEVVAIIVSLKVGGQPALFALLAADGTVNRMGSGLVDASDRTLYIGKAEPAMFQELRSKISAGVNYFLGQRLAAPNPVGTLCELTIALSYASGREAASDWRYGSESQGPHPEIVQFVKETLRITEPWFARQRSAASR